jgi:hypothetical protein
MDNVKTDAGYVSGTILDEPGSVEGLVSWPVYEETTDRYLYISAQSEVRAGFSKIDRK